MADSRPADGTRAETLSGLVSLQAREWAGGRDPTLAEYLARFPELRSRPQILLDMVSQEVVLREAAGERPTPDEYVAVLPELEGDLRALFALDRLLRPATTAPGDHTPSLLADDTAAPAGPATGGSEVGPPGYDLLDEIGRGGMGVIYRARDRSLGRDVAIKLLRDRYPADGQAARRFVDEARITGQLQHPGIPPVHALGVLPDGRPFLAMKLIKGQTLEDRIRRQPDPAADRGRLVAAFEQVCQAVAYAHARGVVHRDLKPANVMVGSFGEVQVMDWGLAKVLGARPADAEDPDATAGGTEVRSLRDGEDWYTQAGSVLGTPAYMPREQAIGAIDQIDRRSDVFGLGGILAAVLTGSPPYVGETAESTRQLAAIGRVTDCFARLDACGADPELVALCKRCLAPEKADRPADAGEVARAVAALRQAADERARRAELERVRAEGERAAAEARAEAEAATRRAAEEAAAGQRRRARLRLMLASAVGLLLLAGGAFGWYADRQAAAERDRLGRNAEAVAALLDQAQAALGAGDAAKAGLLLEAADARAAEGGADGSAGRREALQADLGVLKELDRADQYRWTLHDQKLPDDAKVAARYRAALASVGADPEVAGVAAAARVTGSAVRDRLVAVLDYVLWQGESRAVRAALRVIDPDPFRDAVRDARVAGRASAAVAGPAAGVAVVAGLARRPGSADEPPGFVAVLGGDPAVPVEVRRGLLAAAIRRRPADPGLLLSLGWTYLVNQRAGVDELTRWFQAAVVAAPSSSLTHADLGWALQQKGDIDGAIAENREATRIDPNFADAHNNLGMALQQKGDLDGAIAAHKEAIRIDPNLARAHTNLGVALVRKGDLEGAIAAHKEAIRVDPDFAGAHYNLGVALGRKDDYDGAITQFREAIRLDPNFAQAHDDLVWALQQRGELDRAIAEYKEAIRIDPKSTRAHNSLGIALQQRGELDGAIAEYRETVRLDPNFALAHDNLGVALQQKGNLDGAVVAHKEAIRIDPNFARAHDNLGWALQRKGNIDGAIAAHREAIRIDPNLANTHDNLGVALQRKGDYDGAIAAHKEAIRIDPNFARAHTNLGWALQQKGNLDGAVAAHKEAIRIDPNFARAHDNLGVAWERKGDLDGAIAEYREALRLDPKFARAHNNLGVALERKGDYDGAVAAHKEAIRIDPNFALAHNNLGWALQRKGDLDGAIAEYREALRLDPNQQYAVVNLPRAERLRALLARLPGVLAGTDRPATAAEMIGFAELCVEPFQRRFAAAARLYDQAFAADMTLADVVLGVGKGHRYDAACFAALAARGEGADAPTDAAGRSALRAQALSWLRADLAVRRKQATSSSGPERRASDAALGWWLADPNLATVRSGMARLGLPAEERAGWDAFWADVKATLAVARTPTPPPRETR